MIGRQIYGVECIGSSGIIPSLNIKCGIRNELTPQNFNKDFTTLNAQAQPKCWGQLSHLKKK